LFILFLGEYSVPHACGLSVYATDLLGLAENYGLQTIEVLWPSLPLTLVLLLGGAGAWSLWSRSADRDDALATSSRPPMLSNGSLCLVLLLVGGSVLMPILKLAWRPSLPAWFAEAWRTYHRELLQSLGTAMVAGGAAAVMGIGLATWSVSRSVAAVWSLAFGVLPGALSGEALVSAYLNIPAVYDSWGIVVLAYVARFGWVGVLAGWLVMRSVRSDLTDQARADGADEFVIDTRIRLWSNWPTVICGAGLVAVLSLSDVTAISLVQVPTIGVISLKLIEKMHRFEDNMLVSLSLWLVVSALPVPVLLAAALRRRS
jgi:ABC-type Fe3+ transport system permease subunit